MDIYLPNEFYELREDLPDWRDASPCERVMEKASDYRAAGTDTCADPSWRVF